MFKLLVEVLLTDFVGYIKRPISSNQSLCVGKPMFIEKARVSSENSLYVQICPSFFRIGPMICSGYLLCSC